jgi:3-isopropylmalate dehydrogenase
MPKIAVLPGDGIGPQITASAVRVLQTVRTDLIFNEAPVGGAALAQGLPPLPDATFALVKECDALLFGSVGLPEYDAAPMAQRPEAALFTLRKRLELFANLRPVRVFPGLEAASSLKPELIRGLDLLVVRELTGGLYFGERETWLDESGVECAYDTMVYSATEIERIVRIGFELARTRSKRLTSVDKENVLDTSRLWRKTTLRVAREYPDVRLEHLLIDNAAMQLVRRPLDFDVVVTENTFGDILSDEAAIVTGSIGMLPSASLGAGTPGLQFGMYEPSGGTAPDITGHGIANPTGSILSAALLLRYSLNDAANAERIERAVVQAYADGGRTADVAAGGPALSTLLFTDAVIARL